MNMILSVIASAILQNVLRGRAQIQPVVGGSPNPATLVAATVAGNVLSNPVGLLRTVGSSIRAAAQTVAGNPATAEALVRTKTEVMTSIEASVAAMADQQLTADSVQDLVSGAVTTLGDSVQLQLTTLSVHQRNTMVGLFFMPIGTFGGYYLFHK